MAVSRERSWVISLEVPAGDALQLPGATLHVLQRLGFLVGAVGLGGEMVHHALAVALRPEQAQRSVNLEVDDPRITQYLRGSPWLDDGPPGRVLVTVDGFPLGWARRGGGRLASRYPIHLRQKGPL